MNKKEREVVYCGTCLMLSVWTSYVAYMHIHALFGLLMLIFSTFSVLHPTQIVHLLQRTRAELAKPLDESIMELSPMVFFRQVCRRADATDFFPEKKVLAEQQRRHPGKRSRASSHRMYLHLCLLMQVNVWCHTAICFANHRIVPLWIALAGLAIAMTLEFSRWLKQTYRPFYDTLEQYEALKETLVTLPADQLETLLHRYELAYGLTREE